ncbi:hypothetical protein DPMN_178245 [Dreissena polymorpha]|uniref:Uncharacterized protein n=1 Tax=Dreissena polymorpha TaxID=45954 RepID=A0A9D4IL90_DREPO|nr:hypothetical protein DPMN_178245 [Dreissena polymorpha]
MDISDQKRKRFRSAEDNELDNAEMTWFMQARTEGMPISGFTLHEQANLRGTGDLISNEIMHEKRLADHDSSIQT